MPIHAFVDESDRGAYLVCAAVVVPADLGAVRQVLRGFCLPGQRRLHFKSESNARRKQILDALVTVGVRARVYVCSGPTIMHSRRQCLAALVGDLARLGAQRLVIESQQGQDQRDRQVILEALLNYPALADRLSYEHMRPYEEPGLWAADAIAWAYGAGTHWRSQVAEIVTDVITVEP